MLRKALPALLIFALAPPLAADADPNLTAEYVRPCLDQRTPSAGLDPAVDGLFSVHTISAKFGPGFDADGLSASFGPGFDANGLSAGFGPGFDPHGLR